jgi:hypothetical protein
MCLFCYGGSWQPHWFLEIYLTSSPCSVFFVRYSVSSAVLTWNFWMQDLAAGGSCLLDSIDCSPKRIQRKLETEIKFHCTEPTRPSRWQTSTIRRKSHPLGLFSTGQPKQVISCHACSSNDHSWPQCELFAISETEGPSDVQKPRMRSTQEILTKYKFDGVFSIMFFLSFGDLGI